MHDTVTNAFYNGGARPFKNNASLEKLQPSDFFNSPYTKKQLRQFEYIGKMAGFFIETFESADVIAPEAKYDGIIKHTFGADSKVYKAYKDKAQDPATPAFQPTLYIDFEAMNMRICGWYAELVTDSGITVYDGIARPFADTKYVKRLWDRVYNELLTYNVEDICEAKHIRNFERYFIDIFSKARRIYTYGDTDALFVKKTFGNDLYNFFKVKNIDASVKVANRVVSLDKACRLLGVDLKGDAHNPEYDVQRMRAVLDIVDNL